MNAPRKKRVLIPLPDHDFDITEVSVPWHMLVYSGIDVHFASEHGQVPQADPLLITGVLCGQLGAEREALAYYNEMIQSRSFQQPLLWRNVIVDQFDGLLLPGGHAKGMRQYLGSRLLQRKISEFWKLDRPVAAICHGPLVLARATDENGASLLADRLVTALPKAMEFSAFCLTALCRGRYYRTYPEYVEDEVRSKQPAKTPLFTEGPSNRLAVRGTAVDHSRAFTVLDGNLLTARWPGDAYLFAQQFITMLDVWGKRGSDSSSSSSSPLGSSRRACRVCCKWGGEEGIVKRDIRRFGSTLCRECQGRAGNDELATPYEGAQKARSRPGLAVPNDAPAGPAAAVAAPAAGSSRASLQAPDGLVRRGLAGDGALSGSLPVPRTSYGSIAADDSTSPRSFSSAVSASFYSAVGGNSVRSTLTDADYQAAREEFHSGDDEPTESVSFDR